MKRLDNGPLMASRARMDALPAEMEYIRWGRQNMTMVMTMV